MTKLQELICTKINHDIIGNVGAVCNAVELLEEDDMEFIDDIKSILKTSSFVLASRLKFFRIIFGSDNAVVENQLEVVQNYVDTVSSKNYPIKVDLKNLDKKDLKVVFLQIMIISEFLIKGGNINADGKKIEVLYEKINQEKFEVFCDFTKAQETPSNAGALYLAKVLNSLGKKLKFDLGENSILVEVV